MGIGSNYDIAHITPRVLAAAAGVCLDGKKDNIAYMKLLLAKNPSLAVTEEVVISACRISFRNLKPLAWILTEYSYQLLSETPMAILVHGLQFPPIVEIIKQRIPKLNITPALLDAAANNPFSEKPLGILLLFDVKDLLSETILIEVVRSKRASLKLGVIHTLHPASMSP